MTKAREIAELGQKLTVDGSGNLDFGGDMKLTEASPAITFVDTSVTNLQHKINSSSDNLRFTIDENDVDAGNRAEFVVQNNTVRLTKAENVFNENGYDIDFRVESNDNSALFFVDGGTNRVGINTQSPAKMLHLSQPTLAEMRIQNSTNSYALDLAMNDTVGQVKASADLALMPGGIEKWRIDSSGNVTQTNTGTGAGAGPYLNLYRNSSSPANGDSLGIIQFNGEDSAGNTTNYASIASEARNVTDGNEDGLIVLKTFKNGTNTSRMVFREQETNVNDSGADLDFRVESDAVSDAFQVDASENRIMLGTTTWMYSGTNGTTDKLHFRTRDNGDLSKYIRTNAYWMEYSGNSNEGHVFIDSGNAELLRLRGSTNSTPYRVDIAADNGLYIKDGMPFYNAARGTVTTDSNGYAEISLAGWSWGTLASFKRGGYLAIAFNNDSNEDQHYAFGYSTAVYFASRHQYHSQGANGGSSASIDLNANGSTGGRKIRLMNARASSTFNYVVKALPIADETWTWYGI